MARSLQQDQVVRRPVRRRQVWQWSATGRPPAVERGGGGIVSTTDDWLAFASALLAGGAYRGERVLFRPAVTLMTTDRLSPDQKAAGVPGHRRLTAC